LNYGCFPKDYATIVPKGLIKMPKIYDIKSLGELIRETRNQQGLTQEQLSATAGVGVRFIRELEQGKESCQIGRVLKVARMLGLEAQFIKRGEK
jgi:y4mF family transcriptional regulator